MSVGLATRGYIAEIEEIIDVVPYPVVKVVQTVTAAEPLPPEHGVIINERPITVTPGNAIGVLGSDEGAIIKIKPGND